MVVKAIVPNSPNYVTDIAKKGLLIREIKFLISNTDPKSTVIHTKISMYYRSFWVSLLEIRLRCQHDTSKLAVQDSNGCHTLQGRSKDRSVK